MRTIPFLLIIGACAVVFALCPCLATEEPAAEGEGTATTSATPDVDNPIVARVEGYPIRQSDVDRLYVDFNVTVVDVPVERAIGELIRRESIRQFILASDVEIDDADVDAEYNEFMQRVVAQGLTPEEFLEQKHFTQESLREVLRIQLGLEKLAEQKLTNKEIEAVEKQVRASHILVSVPREDPTEADYEEAKNRILFIKQEIENGQTFEECAKLYSDCPSKQRGGDLGFFPRTGAMVEPFAEAAYALGVGELSEPVKTQFGYHLITVTDRSKRPGLKQLIDQKIPEVIEEVRAKVTVERYDTSEAPESEEDN